ncbi:hypothetical protein ABZY10_34735 [Streptomyces sp. NPDC006539]|uniref:hypothetical protein n=1 Tax=Streptomyces sp. NPDC006539 TaxID=3155352 RepID=UPI00339EC4C0
MKHDRPVKRLALAVGLLGLAVTACGTQTSSVGAAPPTTPGMTQNQALDAVRAYDRANNAANAHLDAAALPGIEVPPLLTADQAWMTITRQLHQTVPEINSTSPSFYLPAVTTSPTWFLAVSTRTRSGVPGPQPTYSIYVRSRPGAPWKVAYSLTPSGEVPDLQVDAKRVAPTVTGSAGLVIAPGQLGKAILAHYVQGLDGKDSFSHSAALDEQLGNGYSLGVQALKEKGTNLSRVLGKSNFTTYSLRTSDGGVLAFTANTVTDSLVSTKSGGIVSLRAGSNDAALFGKPQGATAKKFSITRIESFLTYIPKKSEGALATVLAYDETAITIK